MGGCICFGEGHWCPCIGGQGWGAHPQCPLQPCWQTPTQLVPPGLQPSGHTGHCWVFLSLQLSAAHHTFCFVGTLGSWAKHHGILEIATLLSLGKGSKLLYPPIPTFIWTFCYSASPPLDSAWSVGRVHTPSWGCSPGATSPASLTLLPSSNPSGCG